MPVVASLHLYPVKSLAGVGAQRIAVDEHGPALDRDFMVVDSDGVFVTQRSEPRMALAKLRIEAESMLLEAPGAGELRIPLARGQAGVSRKVRCWFDEMEAEDQGAPAAEWLEAFLGRPLRLVRTTPGHARAVPRAFTTEDSTTRFTDAFPFLLISEASLELLNEKAGQAFEMRRFRPNIVVRDCEAHAEDDWKRIRIGKIEYEVAKPCSRCAVTTVDPENGRVGKEPLKTLAAYRRQEHPIPGAGTEQGVFFGMNLSHCGRGLLEVGTEVELLA